MGTETSKYHEEKRTNVYSPSSGERKGRSPNLLSCKLTGVVKEGVVRLARIESVNSIRS